VVLSADYDKIKKHGNFSRSNTFLKNKYVYAPVEFHADCKHSRSQDVSVIVQSRWTIRKINKFCLSACIEDRRESKFVYALTKITNCSMHEMMKNKSTNELPCTLCWNLLWW